MWYKIPTSVNNIYKGWEISIVKASNWNRTLKVAIFPGVEMKLDVVNSLTSDERIEYVKKSFEFDKRKMRYSHSFIVKKRYLGILEITEPWGQALEEAKEYIDNKLGPFKLEDFLKLE